MFGATPTLPQNSNWSWGQNQTPTPEAGEHSLLVIPFRKNRILLISQTLGMAVIDVRDQPIMLADGSDWDILRGDSIQCWVFSSVPGRIQAQVLNYAAGPAVVNLPPVTIEYTPMDTPALLTQQDLPPGASVTATLDFPRTVTFPTDPRSNDVPAPATLGSALSRTYGVTLTLAADPGHLYSPQVYGLDVIAQPVFMDNPATPVTVPDTGAVSRVMSAEISMGSLPGDGHARATVLDVPPLFTLNPYYYRSEMPVQLTLPAGAIFTGYTDRIEAEPLRKDHAPWQLQIRAGDRWLLLETSFLRDQRDYTGVGHITTVDIIARQCGIDTGSPPGTLAEYPAGWNGALASVYDTPLDIPVFGTASGESSSADNAEGNQLLGWKPQLLDTGATYLKRIQDFYSGWLMGFRLDGTFYYLPFDYFKTPSLTFHAYHGGVSAGLMPSIAAGLSVSVSAGTALVQGAAVNNGSSITIGSLADNSTNYLYLLQNGSGTSNTTGTAPAGSISLGTALTAGGSSIGVDTTPGSGRQLATDPVYRHPVEHRTIEPSGNVVQVYTHYTVDMTANRSGLWVDWASIYGGPLITPNYLGRYKWFVEEVQGTFTPAQLNAMAYLVFQRARRRRKRISIQADFAGPGFKVGQVATVEGYGSYRLIEFRGDILKSNWETCQYLLESTEPGFSS